MVQKGITKAGVWTKVLKTALELPGARVDRSKYLEKELSKYYSEEVVEKAIEERPILAGIPVHAVNSMAKSAIKSHRAKVTALSFVAGLPGGLWIAGTIPADLAQFFWHVIVVTQKLAYLYGWPMLQDPVEEMDEETLHVFTLFVGVMLGASSAAKGISKIAEKLSKEVVKRLPRMALTKYGVYNLSKQVAKWIGIRLTKQSFAKGVGKFVPILGGFISGIVTWITYSRMSKRLRKHLSKLYLATGKET